MTLFLHAAYQEYFTWPLPAERTHFLSYLQVVNRSKDIPATVYTGILGLAGKSAFSAYDTFAKEKTKQASARVRTPLTGR